MGEFIGRSTELLVLRELSDAVGAGALGAHAIVVVGESGVGKTRLLAEATADGPSGVQLLAMRGFEPERNVPLSAALAFVRKILPNRSVARGDPLALFEAVYRGLIQKGPCILVVDDLQWMDDRSLSLLHYLLRGAASAGGRLGLVIASRPYAGSATFIEGLRRLLPDRFTELDLGPLPEAEARALAESLAPGGGSANIAERAAGSPFWIEVLATSGGDDREAFKLVEDRLRRLDADDVELFALLALAGRPMPLDEASDALGWSQAQGRHTLDRLASAGVAQAGIDGASVTHDLMREAAVSRLPQGTRRRLHRALADHVERTAGEDVSLLRQALEHRLQAGELPHRLALRLAVAPDRRLLGEDGLADLIAFADRLPSTEPTAVDMHRAVARLSAELGEHAAALDRWRTVVDRDADPSSRGEAAVAGAIAALATFDHEAARWFVAAARSCLAMDSDPVLRIMVDAAEASVIRWLEHRVTDARLVSERALAGARRLAAREGHQGLGERERAAYLQALRSSFDAAMQAVEPFEMRSLAEEMQALAANADERSHLEARFLVGVAELHGGRPVVAEQLLREVWNESARRILPQLHLDAGFFLANRLVELGRLDAARTVVEEAAALASRIGDYSSFRNRTSSAVARVETIAGDWGTGLRMLAEVAAAQTDPHYRIGTLQEQATWRARIDGRPAATEVRRTVAEIFGDAAAAGCRRCTLEAEVTCAELLAICGADADAWSALDRWQRDAPERPHPIERIHAARTRARLDPSPDRLAELSTCADEMQAAGYLLEWSWALMTLAELLPADDRPAAIAALSTARETSRVARARTLEFLAAQRLRALGVRTWRRPSSKDATTGGPLSNREREVAERIAAGESNAHIADALFLSRRTVDRHVENILRKLVVPNRAAVAAWVRADDGALTPGSPGTDFKPAAPNG